MNKTENLFCGQIVISKSGRDKGRLFVVMEIVDEEYIMLADGDLRKVERPKKKNVKHVAKHGALSAETAEKIKNKDKIENIDLRRILEPLEIERL